MRRFFETHGWALGRRGWRGLWIDGLRKGYVGF